MSDQYDEFRTHVDTVREHASSDLGEANTKAFLITPVLHLLGYQGLKDIQYEVHISSTKEFLDYQLFVDGKPFCIVEAKSVKTRLNDQAAGQCVKYASMVGVRWCLVTNGATWAVYDAYGRGSLEEKHVATVSLVATEADAEEAWRVLSLFSKMHGPPVESALVRLLVQRVVEDELSDRNSAAVSALREAIHSRFGETVTAQAIIEVLPQLQSSPSEPLGAEQDTFNEGDRVEPPFASTTPSPAGTARIEIMDLIVAGLIPESAVLEGKSRSGERPMAIVRSDGLEVDGRLYKTPSAAALAVRGGTSINGWLFWTYQGQSLATWKERLGSEAGPAK